MDNQDMFHCFCAYCVKLRVARQARWCEGKGGPPNQFSLWAPQMVWDASVCLSSVNEFNSWLNSTMSWWTAYVLLAHHLVILASLWCSTIGLPVYVLLWTLSASLLNALAYIRYLCAIPRSASHLSHLCLISCLYLGRDWGTAKLKTKAILSTLATDRVPQNTRKEWKVFSKTVPSWQISIVWKLAAVAAVKEFLRYENIPVLLSPTPNPPDSRAPFLIKTYKSSSQSDTLTPLFWYENTRPSTEKHVSGCVRELQQHLRVNQI